jgi:putative FmdB family regulatory protein
MPVYVFKCPQCGTVRESLQAISAPSPRCSNHDGAPVAMKKQVTACRFRIDAGHSWYRRDEESGKPPFDGIGKF